MDCKAARHWHIVVDGEGCPDHDKTVVGVWVIDDEPYAELCKYNADTKEWESMNNGTRGDLIIDPDYWIEFPD